MLLALLNSSPLHVCGKLVLVDERGLDGLSSALLEGS